VDRGEILGSNKGEYLLQTQHSGGERKF